MQELFGDASPMSQRNFPPSFWNSNYQSSSSIPGTLTHAELAYSCDPYHAASAGAAAFHGLHAHQADPWHYSLSTQSPYSHRQMHDLAAYSATMPATSRFNTQYSSLILQPPGRPSRLPPVPGQCPPLGKADAWAAATAPRYHEPLGPADLAHLDSNYTASGHSAYPTMGNMAGIAVLRFRQYSARCSQRSLLCNRKDKKIIVCVIYLTGKVAAVNSVMCQTTAVVHSSSLIRLLVPSTFEKYNLTIKVLKCIFCLHI
uniref:Uncharacterized protein n=1 Tax=Strigamia maritima TaxID=126957 RepID=T1JLP9_STRMM